MHQRFYMWSVGKLIQRLNLDNFIFVILEKLNISHQSCEITGYIKNILHLILLTQQFIFTFQSISWGIKYQGVKIITQVVYFFKDLFVKQIGNQAFYIG